MEKGKGTALTFAKLDELIDAVKGGKLDILLTSRRSRRKIKALLSEKGHQQSWDGVPIVCTKLFNSSDVEPMAEN